MIARVLAAVALVIGALCCPAPSGAQASTPTPIPTCVVPFVFQPITVAQAGQVNSNFNAVAACSNAIAFYVNNFVGQGFPIAQCAGIATCSPAGGPTPGFGVASPNATFTGCGTGSFAWPNLTVNTTGCGAGATPYPTPTAFATATACGAAVSATGLDLFVPVCPTSSPQITPSPNATATGCATVSWTGSYPYTISINSSSCSGGGGNPCTSLSTPAPDQAVCTQPFSTVATPSPLLQVGDVAISGNHWIGGPGGKFCSIVSDACMPSSPYPSPSAFLNFYNGGGQCELSNYSAIGADQFNVINGVLGQQLSVGCGGAYLGNWGLAFGSDTLGNHNSLGIVGDVHANNFYCCDGGPSSGVGSGSSGGVVFPGSSTEANVCILGNAEGEGYIQLRHGTESLAGTCTLQIVDIAGNSTLCTSSTSVIQTCASPAASQITCSISGTTCNGTATVPSGSVCVVSYDEAATTATPLTDLLPPLQKVVSATLTAYAQSSASITGTIGLDYVCRVGGGGG